MYPRSLRDAANARSHEKITEDDDKYRRIYSSKWIALAKSPNAGFSSYY